MAVPYGQLKVFKAFICEWVCRRWRWEGLLSGKSAKPRSPFRLDPLAAQLQTPCLFSELAVRVAGGRDEGGVRKREGGVRFDRNTGTSSYHLAK